MASVINQGQDSITINIPPQTASRARQVVTEIARNPTNLIAVIRREEGAAKALINQLQPQCNPLTDLSCPFWLYIIIFVLSVIISLYIIITQIKNDRNGNPISSEAKFSAAIIGLGFHFVFGLIIGILIYKLCQRCRAENAWVLFWLSIISPIIFIIVGLFIIEVVLGAEVLFKSIRN